MLEIPDSLFVSDLHSEKGFNTTVYKYLEKKERSHNLYFIGDTRMHPDSYADIPHTPIMGNHEYRIDTVRKGLVDHILLTDEVLLIHGHNTEKQAGFFYRYLMDVNNFFTTHYAAIKNKSVILSLNGNTVGYTKPNGSIRIVDSVRLTKLQKEIAQCFPEVNTVLVGHHHLQYLITIKGCTFFNCGGGFRGEHIEVTDGILHFCSFTDVIGA